MPATVYPAKLQDAYSRYIGPLGSQLQARHGMNPTTHVASIRMDAANPTKSERAVVKFFQMNDRGWFNEYFSWTLAQHLGVKTAPRAALLVGTAADITAGHGPELNQAAHMGSAPMVLWCTSAVEPASNVQQAMGAKWDRQVLTTPEGRRLAAMDAWLGNCDRIAANLLMWRSSIGGLVAIDHEKSAFNEPWPFVHARHLDETLGADGKPIAGTVLLNFIQKAAGSKEKSVQKAASSACNDLFHISETSHPKALSDCQRTLADHAELNFGPQAAQHLLSFLSYRASEDCMKRRYGLVI